MAKQIIKMSLSIIVPVFNEEDGVEEAVKQIYRDISSNPVKKIVGAYEVIVVDDGSTDKTGKILKNVKRKFKDLNIVRHRVNQGLGASIVTGIKYSTKEYVTYLPADGQAFLREIYKGLLIARTADLVLTYRGVREDYNVYRHMLSNVLMIFMKIFFNLSFKDYNWVHIYRRRIFDSIKIKSKGVFFLGEVVARVNAEGFKILEAEASYNPRSTGVSKNARFSVALRTLRDLISLWWDLKFKPQ